MEKDLISSSFFSDNDRYADIINGIGCDGVPFVKGEDLQEADTPVVLSLIHISTPRDGLLPRIPSSA